MICNSKIRCTIVGFYLLNLLKCYLFTNLFIFFLLKLHIFIQVK